MRNAIPLDTTLATDLLTPLLAYTALLREGGAYAQSRLLSTLVDDVDRKIMRIFDQVNCQAPGLTVKLPSIDLD